MTVHHRPTGIKGHGYSPLSQYHLSGMSLGHSCSDVSEKPHLTEVASKLLNRVVLTRFIDVSFLGRCKIQDYNDEGATAGL